jgi:predicted ATPase/class 3 adenylate cyclase
VADGEDHLAPAPVAEPLPIGVVTFLLTDIEGSTALWDEYPQHMAQALVRHETVVADIVARHDGRLLKSRGEGDATLSVFLKATDATAAAVAIQRRFQNEPWPGGLDLPTRIALHTGEAHLRDGDYYGGTLNRAARIRGLAGGGQVLVSRATHDLVADTLPADARLIDLGTRELRGLRRDETVFALHAPGLPDVERLPAPQMRERNAFIGRGDTLARVIAAIGKPGLVTITGPGGIGKTRLGVEAFDRVDASFRRQYHVPLVAVRDAAGVESAIRSVLALDRERRGIPQPMTGDADLADAVASLAGPLLVVLDNCEQVHEEVADVVDRLLVRCPRLSVLATSREPLGVPGERVIALDRLAVPSPGAELDVDALAQVDAVVLLCARVRDAGVELRLDGDHGRCIGDICRQVDGIPLALELAAARLATTTPADLLARISRLDILSSRRGDPRHRSLHAAIDWSYQLLDPQLQAVHRRLGVFVGGFTLDAAEEVCGDVASANDVYLALSDLVAKSLVVFDADLGRYRLLEPIRVFALDRLTDTGEHPETAQRHAAWVLRASRAALIDQLTAGVPGDRFSIELPNVYAALDRLLETRDYRTLRQIVAQLGNTWALSSDWRSGLVWAQRALDAPDPVSARMRATLLLTRGIVEPRADPRAAVPWLEAARNAFVELEDPVLVAWATYFLGRSLFFSDQASQQALLHEAIEQFRETNQPLGEAWALLNLATERARLGDKEAGLQLQRALEISAETGFTAFRGVALIELAKLALERGDTTAARDLAYDALTEQRANGDQWNNADILADAAWIELMRGNLYAGDALAREAIRATIDLDDEWTLRHVLAVIAASYAKRGNIPHARAIARATRWRIGPSNDSLPLTSTESQVQRFLAAEIGLPADTDSEIAVDDLYELARQEATSSDSLPTGRSARERLPPGTP